MMYYDKRGKLIGVLKWARMFEDPRYRVIGQSTYENIVISTIWVGFDMGFGFIDGSPPLMFESIVFEVPMGDDVWKSLEQRRYYTLEQAQVGHTELCHIITTMMQIDEEVRSADAYVSNLRDLPDLSTYQEDPGAGAEAGEGAS